MDVNAKKAKSIKNAEKRRERSKVAARCRRGKESEIFNDLSESLPIPESCKSSLDKASVMRLTLCNLGIKTMMNSGFVNGASIKKSTNYESEFESQINQALGGFILVFGLDGDVIYASEGITTQLGISQYEIMGQSIFDFSHQYDHNDIRAMLMVHKKSGEVREDEQSSMDKRSCLFRMKCTLSSRGKNSHARSSNYKILNCIGKLVTEDKMIVGGAKDENKNKWFVSICEPLLHPSDVDIPLNKQSFLSKHSPDMKFEYVDETVGQLLGYTREEMMGKSLFEFSHAADGAGMAKAFKSLYDKEQNQTDCYRFLTKGGGWIWVMTQATVIHGSGPSSNKTPNSVVCIHFVISGREEKDQILSQVQIGERAAVPAVAAVPIVPITRGVLVERKMNTNNNKPNFKTQPTPVMNSEEENNFIADLLVGPLLNQATCSTAKIFAPKTKDMDTGFLMPVNIDGHGDKLMIASTELQPDDLTHLAPIAGDECVPLDVPLLEDLLASLDEDDMSYSFLDGDEITKYEAEQQMLKFTDNTPQSTQLTGDNATFSVSSSPMMNPMMLGVDPLMVSGSSLSPLMFINSPSPLPVCSLSPRPRAASFGGMQMQQLGREGQDLVGYLRGGGAGIPAGISALPPDLDLALPIPMIEDKFDPGVPVWINQQNAAASKKFGPIPQLFGANSELTSIGNGPPPNKVQKLVGTVPPGMIGHIQRHPEAGTGDERLYILVPVRGEQGRRASYDSSIIPRPSSGSDSDSSGISSNDPSYRGGGQTDLINLVLGQQGQIQRHSQINQELMSTIGQNGRSNSISKRKRNFAGSLLGERPIMSFHDLTRQDCEVNAPLSKNADLLMGPDLLQALDTGARAIAI